MWKRSHQLYDIESHVMYSSRDVKFIKHIFPFKQRLANTDVILLASFALDAGTNDDVDPLPTDTTTDATLPDVTASLSDTVVPNSAPSSSIVSPSVIHRSSRSTIPLGWLKNYVACVVSPFSSDVFCSFSLGKSGQ